MTANLENARWIPAVALGLAAGLGQVVLLRELLALAGGSELALSMGLAVWLLWSAIGGLSGKGAGRLLGRLPDRFAAQYPALAGPTPPLVLATAGGVASLFLTRALPLLLGPEPGAVAGLGQAALAALIALAPAGFLAGLAFPLLLNWANEAETDPAAGLGRLYGLEALGAMAGGAAFALLLAGSWVPLRVLALAGLAAGLAASCFGVQRTPAKVWAALMIALIFSAPALDLASLEWSRGRILDAAETPYARLVVVKNGKQRDFFANGRLIFSLPPDHGVTRTALLPLLAHPHPKSVLLVGGGASGAAARAARIGRAERVVSLELDPGLYYLADRLGGVTAPPNLTRRHGDAREFMEQTYQRFDVAVLDLPPPATMGLSRYYSAEGLAALARVLNPGGVAVIALPGMENLVGPLQARRLATVLAAAAESFAGRGFFFGPKLRIMLSVKPGVISGDPTVWNQRLQQRRWQEIRGLEPAVIIAGLDPMRAKFLEAALKAAGGPEPNQDLTPRALLWDPDTWGTLLHGWSGGARLLAGLKTGHLAWPLLALALLLFWAVRRGRATGLVLPLGVVVSGFTAMAMSMLILMAYQVLFGSVYLGLALVVAGFMAGMSAASLAVAARGGRAAAPGLVLALISLCTVAACQATWLLLKTMHDAAAGPAWAWAWVAAAAVNGGLAGSFFCLAARLHPGLSAAGPAWAGGRLYALELAGGVTGALVPMVLAPSLGLGACLLLVGMLNLLPLAALLANGQGRGARTRP